MSVFRHESGLKLRQKVRAVIINPVGEFLLVRPHGYREGEWTLAGGGVEHGETVHEAMRREIAEELGVTLEDAPEELPIANRFTATQRLLIVSDSKTWQVSTGVSERS